MKSHLLPCRMEPSRLPGSLDSFQMANNEDLCLDLLSVDSVGEDPLSLASGMDLLSTQIGIVPLPAEAETGLLSTHTRVNSMSAEAVMGQLSSHAGVDLSSSEAGMGLLSLQAGVSILTAQTDMDLLTSHANMEPLTDLGVLPVPSNIDVLPHMNVLPGPANSSVGTEDHCMEQKAVLTQSERERLKTQDSLSILGDPDSLELSKVQVEEFYNHKQLEPSGPSTSFSQDKCSWFSEATSEKVCLERERREVIEEPAVGNESGKGTCETLKKQTDVFSQGSTSNKQCEPMSASCDVNSSKPVLFRDQASQFENAAEKERAVSESGIKLEGEQDCGTADNIPEHSMVITDVRALPGNAPCAQEDVNMARGGELPVEGSLSSRSFTTKLHTPVNKEQTPTANTPITESAPKGHQQHRMMRQDSSNAVQQLDEDQEDPADNPKDEDFDPSSRPRRSTRVSSRIAKPTVNNAPAGVPPSRPIASGRQSVSARGPPQRSGAPPPQPPETSSSFICANCHEQLKSGHTAYQRRGLPQLFCSSMCLSFFSRKPHRENPCAYCKNDMANNKNSMIAQIGQTFKEFCNNICLTMYEAKVEERPTQELLPRSRRCSICNQSREIIHEVSTGSTVHLLCSNACFNIFRATKGLKTSCCDACGSYINMMTSKPEYLLHDRLQKRFCNSSCIKLYKMKNTKVLSCLWCKTLGQNFEMLSYVDSKGKIQPFCSMCCITSYKVRASGSPVPRYPCSVCKNSLREPAYYCKENKTIYTFCSPGCWTTFQSNNPNGTIHLNCQACHTMFRWKPEILEWQNSSYEFCSKNCCEDYKRLNGVIAICEHCKQEKVLHKKLKFSGVERNFCSDGCGLLYKEDFVQQLGVFCVDCSYCSQTCFPTVTDERDGNKWGFCSLYCKRKYLQWHLNMACCHFCQRQGRLQETLHWEGEIQHFCNQQCLLGFCSQQHWSNSNPQGHSPRPKSPPAASKKSEAAGRLGAVGRPEATSASSLPPNSVSQKNKSSMCKPMVETVAVTCKPEMKSQSCQTDDYLQSPPLVLPIPVPVYVPLPLQMYCQYTPFTVTLPLPLPVPLFLPSTLDQIVETIKELKLGMPCEPVQADIMTMAETQGETKPHPVSDGNPHAEQRASTLLTDCCLSEPAKNDVLTNDLNIANMLTEPSPGPEEVPHSAPVDLNPSVDFLYDCGIVAPHAIMPEPSPTIVAQRGSKRQAMSEMNLHDPLDSQPLEARLNSSCGVKAWASWVQTKHSGAETRKEEPVDPEKDLLSCSAAELDQGLSQFVVDVVSPRGPCYKPDSVFYLCLGIQQYLLENNRMVNIFTDQLYSNFTRELNDILSGWVPLLKSTGGLVSHILEEHLWECKQLGVYSPFVLLNTLMFFNTKFFGLRTVEEHMQLSFENVVRKTKKISTGNATVKSASVCYQPSSQHANTTRECILGKRKRDDPPELEQEENRRNPLRCPVKFFEFYLFKCPDRVLNSPTSIYLLPECTCTKDSDLWYSDTPMDRGMLGVMLNRILAVRDITGERAGEDDMD